MIRVLVVDDSRLVRAVLREILESDPDVEVVGEAEDGREGVDQCLALGPDVVVMDIQMPVMDGLEAVERIMEQRPTPVIILSATVHPGEVGSAFRAVRAGAFEALPKPAGLTTRVGYEKVAADLLARVHLYARVGKKRGWSEKVTAEEPPSGLRVPTSSDRVVALGASTGGPRTVQRLLCGLPTSFPCPILIVQHISLGFVRGFAHWLQREVALEVRVVERPEYLRKGVVYLPLDGHHLEVRRGMAVLRNTPPVNACRPSVDVLFHSLAREFGGRTIGVVLTGMGRDGAQGALAIRREGGDVIVQNESTCIVYGMPKAVVAMGAATQVLSAQAIPAALADLVGSPAGSSETGDSP